MRLFGLLGFPLTHSFSGKYFETFFKKEGITDASYEHFAYAAIDEFFRWARQQQQLKGFNVTIPHKVAIIPYVDELSPEAKEVGAVNAVKIEKGKFIGYNTDVFGFETSLKMFLLNEKRESLSALVLGTGGASGAVQYVLKNMELPYQLVSRESRRQVLGYEDIDESVIQSNCLIINTTPLGMYPVTNQAPAIPYHFLSENHLLFDLIYNPEITLFLQRGQAKGSRTKNGLEMLYLQAQKSWEIWNI